MKKLAYFVTAAAIAASPALADGPAPVAVVTPVIAPTPSVTDWSGFYAGIGYLYAFGDELRYSDGGVFSLGGDMFGGFAGYNMQSGSLVYGGEITFYSGAVEEDENSPIFNFSQFADVKGRVGYVFGDALIYGSAGWTFGVWNEAGFNAPSDGYNLGAGIDYLITDSIFVGAEYVYRQQNGTWNSTPPNNTLEADIHSVQLRVGMTF